MIKNLIFDLGDVLIDLDKQAVPKALEAYGLKETDPDLILLSRRYETGRIGTDEFLSLMGEKLGETDTGRITGKWNATIGEFPEGRLEFLEALRDLNQYRMYLLSNTNPLHMEYVERLMGPGRFGRLKGCFEGFYLSHEAGMRKPEPELFRYVLGRHGLVPEETVFIDDTLEHIVSAASLGIRTWHLQVGQEDVRELLTRI